MLLLVVLGVCDAGGEAGVPDAADADFGGAGCV